MLGFFLNGRLLPNNSVVLLSDIGEGSNALYCLTDRTLCCSSSAGDSRGLWRFPDGNADGIYTSKGFSSLLLNRRSSTVGPTGVYTCLIPSASDRDRDFSTLRLGIYSSDAEGKYHQFRVIFLRERKKRRKAKGGGEGLHGEGGRGCMRRRGDCMGRGIRAAHAWEGGREGEGLHGEGGGACNDRSPFPDPPLYLLSSSSPASRPLVTLGQ